MEKIKTEVKVTENYSVAISQTIYDVKDIIYSLEVINSETKKAWVCPSVSVFISKDSRIFKGKLIHEYKVIFTPGSMPMYDDPEVIDAYVEMMNIAREKFNILLKTVNQ